MEEDLHSLPAPLVIDHRGRLPAPDGAFDVIGGVLEKRNTWVKLSGACPGTDDGSPECPDATRVAKALAVAAPERMAWGGGWPHRGQSLCPDDALLIDLLEDRVPDEETRNRVFVDNPAELQGFQPSTILSLEDGAGPSEQGEMLNRFAAACG